MQAILNFFKKFGDIIGNELQFVIDDISAEDSSAVGVTWHLGIPIEFAVSCALCSVSLVLLLISYEISKVADN